MESLFIRGKARIIEDALTASLFDLLSALGSSDLVRAILSRAQRVDAHGRFQGDLLKLGEGWDAFQVELWPSWPEGEPDAVVWLLAGGRRVGGLVVEAKFGATKSGDFVEDVPKLRDQLARYARDLQRQVGGGHGLGVVYLTPHNTPPSADLSGSWKAIDGKTELSADAQLSWLPWTRVDEALGEALAVRYPPESTEARLVRRVRAVLGRAGLRSFQGWGRSARPEPVPEHPRILLTWLQQEPGRPPNGFTGWSQVPDVYSMHPLPRETPRSPFPDYLPPRGAQSGGWDRGAFPSTIPHSPRTTRINWLKAST